MKVQARKELGEIIGAGNKSGSTAFSAMRGKSGRTHLLQPRNLNLSQDRVRVFSVELRLCQPLKLPGRPLHVHTASQSGTTALRRQSGVVMVLVPSSGYTREVTLIVTEGSAHSRSGEFKRWAFCEATSTRHEETLGW